jgi:cytochrome oxidase assembly protein ShyY1
LIKINRKTDVILKQSVPYILALILIYCFASLGLWQLDRAKEKTSELNTFNSPDAYISVKDLSDI